VTELFNLDGFAWYTEHTPIQLMDGVDLRNVPSRLGERFLAHIEIQYYEDVSRSDMLAIRFVDGRSRWTAAEKPLLFREFANMPFTPEGFVDFANKHGFLFGRDDKRHYQCQTLDSSQNCFAESLDDWYGLQTSFRSTYDLWQAIKVENIDFLKAILRFNDNFYKIPFRIEGQEMEAHERAVSSAELELWGIQEGDYLGAARAVLVKELDILLKMETRFNPSIRALSGGDISVTLEPWNLLGTLVLQLVLAVTGNKEFRQCKACDKWFELHPDKARTNRLHCSNECRFKAHKQKRDLALKYSEEGWSLARVAQELSSNEETIMNWISKAQSAKEPKKPQKLQRKESLE